MMWNKIKKVLKLSMDTWLSFPEWVRVIGWITITVMLTMMLQSLRTM